jgi:acetate kinase
MLALPVVRQLLQGRPMRSAERTPDRLQPCVLMTLLTINSGSTSVKLALYQRSAQARLERIDSEQHSGSRLDATALLRVLGSHLPEAPQAIAHRIVHGGTRFTQPVRIDSAVLAALEQLSPLAPLHNPLALRWVTAARAVWGAQLPQVAVFDTAYFANLPRVAAEYALPPQLGVDRGVRRYGFHGLAHQAMWQRFCELYPQLPRGGRLITLQLGGGCSIAAIRAGQPLDTSMGFSPLEGLVMATRSGDLDPASVAYLQTQLNLSGEQVVELLNHQSGLAGLSGSDANPEALLADASAQSQFAAELYCYRIRKYLGAYLTVLEGCDGIVFGGGVGEHAAGVRARALAGLSWAGIALDGALNAAARGGEACISAPDAAVRIHVVAVDENAALAAAAAAII